jgi:hypothetical protein
MVNSSYASLPAKIHSAASPQPQTFNRNAQIFNKTMQKTQGRFKTPCDTVEVVAGLRVC